MGVDLHAVTFTPGAVLVLGTGADAVALGDGASAPGVPLNDKATLVGWGGLSPTADSIARIKLNSPDLLDNNNGEDFQLGATSLWNAFWQFDSVAFSSGARTIQAGTNVGVVAMLGLLLDSYSSLTKTTQGSRNMPNAIVTPVTTFGGALTGSQWGTVAYNPASPLPAGRYAILGAYAYAITNVGAIRFSHSSFHGEKPGFPVFNSLVISTTSWDKVPKDMMDLVPGYQFVSMGDYLGRPCCPIFDVTAVGTGLQIEMISVQADTPSVVLVLAKV